MAKEVTFTLSAEDFFELQRFMLRENPKVRKGLVMSFLYSFVVVTGFGILSGRLRLLIVVLVGFVAGAISVVVWFSQRRSKAKEFVSKNPSYFGETTVSISPEGLRMKNLAEDTSVGWNVVRDIVESKPYIYVFTGSGGASIIPQSAFKSPDEARRFLDSASSYCKSAKASPESKKT